MNSRVICGDRQIDAPCSRKILPWPRRSFASGVARSHLSTKHWLRIIPHWLPCTLQQFKKETWQRRGNEEKLKAHEATHGMPVE